MKHVTVLSLQTIESHVTRSLNPKRESILRLAQPLRRLPISPPSKSLGLTRVAAVDLFVSPSLPACRNFSYPQPTSQASLLDSLPCPRACAAHHAASTSHQARECSQGKRVAIILDPEVV